jgi:hypothetical protein
MTKTKNAPKDASPTPLADHFRPGNYGVLERRRREELEITLTIPPRVKSRSAASTRVKSQSRGRRGAAIPNSQLIVPTLLPWTDIKGGGA